MKRKDQTHRNCPSYQSIDQLHQKFSRTHEPVKLDWMNSISKTNLQPSLRFSPLNCLGMWSMDCLAEGDRKYLRDEVLEREEGKGRRVPQRKEDFELSMASDGGAERWESEEVAMEKLGRILAIDFWGRVLLRSRSLAVLLNTKRRKNGKTKPKLDVSTQFEPKPKGLKPKAHTIFWALT